MLPGLERLSFTQNFFNGLVIVIADLEALFDIEIAVGLYNDNPDVPQAAARPDPSILTQAGGPPGDGVIAIGRHLIEKLKTENADASFFSAALTAICAHECGHILQFKYRETFDEFYKYVDYSTARELHADFICGYYGFHRQQRDDEYPAVLQAKTLYVRGDDELVAVDHGTYEQRGNAVRAGYLAGKAAVGPESIVHEGLKVVAGLGLKIQD
ncbi:hypothetical protein [Mesorhizobium sp. M0199]|uniref:hypothetical protein n=1 Tax=Mesorhizobium sp. M0199 TaxID=2956911 RepID=UPI00333C7DC4